MGVEQEHGAWDSPVCAFTARVTWGHRVTSLRLRVLTCEMGAHTAPAQCGVWGLPTGSACRGLAALLSFTPCSPHRGRDSRVVATGDSAHAVALVAAVTTCSFTGGLGAVPTV